MNIKAYFLEMCLILSCVMPMTKACQCKYNLKAEACNSDFVLVAKVLEKREMMSQKGWVFHHKLSISDVLKTSEAYEGAEKVLQTKPLGAECGEHLKEGHTYIFAGHVGEFVDKGSVRKFLEVRSCNYVDFKLLAVNKNLKKEIYGMIQNPPVCPERRAVVDRLREINDPDKPFNMFRKKKWNHPFQKKDSQ